MGACAAILLLSALLLASTCEARASEDAFGPATRASLLEEQQRRTELLREGLESAVGGLERTLHLLADLRARELAVRASLAARAAEREQLRTALGHSAIAHSRRREALAALVLKGVRWRRGNGDDRALGLPELRAIALTGMRDGTKATGGVLRSALERATDLEGPIDRAAAELDWLDGRAAIVQQGLASQRRELRELGLVLDEAERRKSVLSATIAKTPVDEEPAGVAARSLNVGLSDPDIVETEGPRERPARGGFKRLPVQGEVVRRFGARYGGHRSRGVVLSGRPQPVLAPGRGRVAYAGPFRALGLLLIIEHGADYHSLVIGASRLEVAVGDPVRDGQIVGWLDGAAAQEAELYLELRRAGEPIDPMLVLSARESEVRG